MLIQVSVQNLKLFIPVGWFPEEIQTLTEVDVSLSVFYKSQENTNDELGDTIDYAALHEIIQKQTRQTFKLLETFGKSVITEIESNFNHVPLLQIRIRIQKPQILELGSNAEMQFVEITKEI
jgi:dihydroneopterin aldolase